MFFHKVTQDEITKAKLDGNFDLYEKLSSEFVKQHKTSKFQKFCNWFGDNLPLLDFIVASISLILAIIALLN